MRVVRRWVTGLLLSVLSISASAVVPYCPPSLEAPPDDASAGTFIAFPRGHLFQPLLADPKEPRFFAGYRYYERPAGVVHVGIIGFGETFPLFRWVGDCAADGLQLDIAGGSVARFQLDDAINDLIDADYSVSLPLSWRRGNWSLRTRIYHESSHLGENELFQPSPSEQKKVSYAGVDLIVSYDKEKWRVYYGVEHLFSHVPTFEPLGLHVGAEYYGPHHLFGGTARWIAGMDVKAWEEYDFEPDFSLRTGFSFGGRQTRQHHMQLLLEWYDGHANEGIFYDDEIRYLGVGVYFGF